MASCNAHILLQMSDEPDCRFVAQWLIKAAEAQGFWSEVLDSPDSARLVKLLYADGIPDLAAAALELFGELEHYLHVVSLDLYGDDSGLLCREFGLLVQLGFFACYGQSYWMAMPGEIGFETVMIAALEVSSTVCDDGDGDDAIEPESRLITLSVAEAEAMRARLIALRRFNAVSECETIRLQAKLDHAGIKHR
ncbi:hypothetical protein [Bradyrhizobium sp. 76]|uniref:hypothetical protein n=1 Tax=Bradyrhizobium sp. 76 TaxID=2782680 RepID=UPI001FF88027|nr:hypothetical protein [Bradyrhizobium sp. 76]MCK1407118.1 hypothetical protein [Bradyrhizobium sp. 76]